MNGGYNMSKETKVTIDYTVAKDNHVRADAQRAVQIFLSGEIGTVITIFPQALNPFLKALESLTIWKQAVVIPSSDSNNKPIYIIVKVDDSKIVSNIDLEE